MILDVTDINYSVCMRQASHHNNGNDKLLQSASVLNYICILMPFKYLLVVSEVEVVLSPAVVIVVVVLVAVVVIVVIVVVVLVLFFVWIIFTSLFSTCGLYSDRQKPANGTQCPTLTADS